MNQRTAMQLGIRRREAETSLCCALRSLQTEALWFILEPRSQQRMG
ncbi:hypothetical protein MUK42_11031 [Musa troglodytarum]|uniref:Uncharacterized protein n=1 Tax=Musa troglodytarum TaxID=320322 RepID=A0A9E7GVU5_9LILI|nr:hypothetical protein MUK42_11031 [Musa troglodytarum]